MCDVNAYIQRAGREELILENVDSVEAGEGTLRLSNIFGEEKVVNGKLKSFSLRENKIILIESS
ncbi:MAG: CooT family nickel-binding protein [Pseudomonadota bacterium]